MEINLLHGDALDSSPTRSCSSAPRMGQARHKMAATFMAKPHAREPIGSAMHIHQSVVDRKEPGKNVFVRRRHADAAVRARIGGLQRYLPAGDGAAGAERQLVPADHALPGGAVNAVNYDNHHRRARDACRCRTDRGASRTNSPGADANPLPVIAASLAWPATSAWSGCRRPTRSPAVPNDSRLAAGNLDEAIRGPTRLRAADRAVRRGALRSRRSRWSEGRVRWCFLRVIAPQGASDLLPNVRLQGRRA